MSSHQNMMSSVENGSPSDHFTPLRKCSVHTEASALDSQLSTSPGPMAWPSLSQRSSEWPYMYSWCAPLSLSPVTVLMAPPYLPGLIQLCGTTYGPLR